MEYVLSEPPPDPSGLSIPVFPNAQAVQNEAANLLVHYGWSPDFRVEMPRTENAFYTVEIKDGTRHYEIVWDSITARFAAIEDTCNKSEFYIRASISNKDLSDEEKRGKIQEILMPRLWWRDGIRMSLTAAAREECNNRINDYIERLLRYNVPDGISLVEHIRRTEMDKSDPSFIWAAPQEFTLSMEDFVFSEYKRNIDAEYNRQNAAMLAAARSMKAAQGNFENVTGDEWTAQEIYLTRHQQR